jgi:hypothetical protein
VIRGGLSITYQGRDSQAFYLQKKVARRAVKQTSRLFWCEAEKESERSRWCKALPNVVNLRKVLFSVIASEAKQSSFSNIPDCFGLRPYNDVVGCAGDVSTTLRSARQDGLSY